MIYETRAIAIDGEVPDVLRRMVEGRDDVGSKPVSEPRSLSKHLTGINWLVSYSMKEPHRPASFFVATLVDLMASMPWSEHTSYSRPLSIVAMLLTPEVRATVSPQVDLSESRIAKSAFLTPSGAYLSWMSLLSEICDDEE